MPTGMTPRMQEILKQVDDEKKKNPALSVTAILKKKKISTSGYYGALKRVQDKKTSPRKKTATKAAATKRPYTRRKKSPSKMVTLPASFLTPPGDVAQAGALGSRVVAFVGDPLSIAELVRSLV